MKSIRPTTAAKINEPNSTKVVLDCKSVSLGHVTLCLTSSQEAVTNSINEFILRKKIARAPGLEPRPTVLETVVLPLNYARVKMSFQIGLQK